jgi:hypothetical protein
MGRPPRSLIVALAVLALGLLAAPAQADFHLMRINEVMLSSGGNAAVQYVELLDSADEGFTPPPPYRVVVYDAAGSRLSAHTISLSLLQMRDNTQPLLLATNAAATAFSVTPDETLSVALPASGKVCFTQGTGESVVQCVTWQCVNDSVSLQRVNIMSETYVEAAPTAKTMNAASGATRDNCPPPPSPPGGGDPPAPPGDPGPGPTLGPSPTPTPLPPLRDTTKPGLSKIAVDAKNVGLTVSEACTVTVTIERKVKNKFTRVKRLTLKATKPGAVKAKMPTLSAATYRITIVCKDAAGNVSRPTTRPLTIKPKKKP